MSNNSRLVIVSNRLPVTARAADQGVQLTPSSGSLATGLQPYHEGPLDCGSVGQGTCRN